MPGLEIGYKLVNGLSRSTPVRELLNRGFPNYWHRASYICSNKTHTHTQTQVHRRTILHYC